MIFRRFVLYLAAVALLCVPVFGQSDWTMARYDEGQTGYTPVKIDVPLSLSWQYDTAEFPDNRSTPAVAGGVVYFSSGNVLWAVDAVTGTLIWRYPSTDTLRNYIKTGITVSGGLVLFGCTDGNLYAVNAKDGRVAWVYMTDGTIRSTPVVSGGVVYFGSDDNNLYAVDLRTGESVWAGGFRTGDDVQAPPAIGPGVVIFISMDANVYGANPANGKLRWNYRLPLSPVRMQPVVSGNLAFIGCGGTIFVLSAKTGQLRYTINLPSDLTAPPVVTGTELYCMCRNRRIYAFTVGQSTARSKWAESPDVGIISYSPLTVAGDTIFAVTRRGTVAAYSTEDGRLLWRQVLSPSQIGMADNVRPTFTNISAPVAVAGNALYVIADDGALRCFRNTAGDKTPPRIFNVVPTPGTAMSGLPPVLISAMLFDDTTGIDPSSVRLLIDDQKVDAKFDHTTLTLTYETPLTTPIQKLSDGRHFLTIIASDWKGNELNYKWSFIADNSLPPRQVPKSAKQKSRTTGGSTSQPPSGSSGAAPSGSSGTSTPSGTVGPSSGPPTPPTGGPPMPPRTRRDRSSDVQGPVD